jgi:DNA-directed RNA polymerase specialized sigma24 family protein
LPDIFSKIFFVRIWRPGELISTRSKRALEKSVQGTDRAAALGALTEDQQKRLAAYARIMSPNTGEEADDLLQGAQLRWLASDEPIESPERTYRFLLGAMSSIRSNIFRHAAVVRRTMGVRVVAATESEEDPIELAPDSGASQETGVFGQQLYNLCTDDPDLQMLLMCQLDRATRAEIQAELGWNDTKYETVQKRKKRLVARWIVEGKLG